MVVPSSAAVRTDEKGRMFFGLFCWSLMPVGAFMLLAGLSDPDELMFFAFGIVVVGLAIFSMVEWIKLRPMGRYAFMAYVLTAAFNTVALVAAIIAVLFQNRIIFIIGAIIAYLILLPIRVYVGIKSRKEQKFLGIYDVRRKSYFEGGGQHTLESKK